MKERTGLSSLAVGRERHLVGCWAAVEREMDGLNVISFDGVGHGVDASEDSDGKDRKGQLHHEWSLLHVYLDDCRVCTALMDGLLLGRSYMFSATLPPFLNGGDDDPRGHMMTICSGDQM